MRILGIVFALLFAGVIAAGAGAWFIKNTVQQEAAQKLADIDAQNIGGNDLDALLMNATLRAFQIYKAAGQGNANPYAALAPLITNPALPGGLRTDSAALGFLYPETDKIDSANHILKYILASSDFDLQEWNIITPRASKNVVIAKLEDGTFKYLDPSSGAVAMYENTVVIGPFAARFLMMDNVSHRKIFVKLDENSDLSFYKEFDHAMMAPPGYPLYISVAAPIFEEPLVLGEINGDSQDVADAASAMDLTPYMDYIGRKHGEAVKRTIYFTDPAKVTFVLESAFDPQTVSTNIEPRVNGNTIVFEVPQDQALIFDDKTDFFIPVDQIIIERL